MAMEAEHAYGGVVWVPERHASVKPTEGLDESVGPLRRERAPATTREADARSLAQPEVQNTRDHGILAAFSPDDLGRAATVQGAER